MNDKVILISIADIMNIPPEREWEGKSLVN